MFALLVMDSLEHALNDMTESEFDDKTIFEREDAVPVAVGTREKRENFWRQQWRFLPPLGRDFPPQDRSWEVSPPFIQEAREYFHGSYGIVRRVKVAREQLLGSNPVRIA